MEFGSIEVALIEWLPYHKYIGVVIGKVPVLVIVTRISKLFTFQMRL